MGYVNLTDISQFIPATQFSFTAGTWTPTLSTYLVSMVKSAADEGVTAFIPISLPASNIGLQGAKLVSIDVWYKVATAALDDFATVALHKQNLFANAVAVTGALIDTAADTDHNLAAERLAVGDHKMTITLNNPDFLDKNKGYYLSLVMDAAATSDLTFFGAQVNFILRI